jgi:tetrahydromethanopterin S-methyltransferase subunit G
MPVVMGDLYVALRAANVPEETAMAAAEEVAAVVHRSRGRSVERSLRILKGLVAINLALAMVLAALVFSGRA